MNAILNIVAMPLGWIMKIIYEIVGNYGVTLILFTFFTKLILFPIAIKQKKSTIKMSAFQPMIADIQKKYANDKVRQQEELSRLQQDHGFSMTAGCLPMLIQMPILFGLIQVIYNPLTHVAGLSSEVIKNAIPIAQNIVGNISAYSPELSILPAVKQNADAFIGVMSASELAFVKNFDMMFLGMDLTATPSLKVFNTLLLIPILSVLAMVAQQIIMTKFSGQKMEGAMKFMPIYSAAMFGYFGFVMPAGVSIYWIFSSVFGILQDVLLRVFFDPEKEKAKIAAEIAEARKKAKYNKTTSNRAAPSADGKMTASSAELAKKRLEKARQLDAEKYGE
ncbi:MAG: YidC/Oxa1 family membrane protein insertase [Oscillospiraceae bacterium]